MNHPMNMGNSSNMMMGAYYPQNGYVTLDPNLFPGQVTLDVEHQSHYNHHSHHHHCHKPNPCPFPPPTPQPVTYVVRQGDSVYTIAQQFGTTMQAIILANNLTNPDLIFPGQVLIIPVV